MECVYIPVSLSKIDDFTFDGCKYLEVCYGASEAKWNQINIAGYGEYGTNKIIYKATKHFNASPADINRYSIG